MLPYRLEWSQRSTLRDVLRRHPLVLVKAPGLRGPELVEVADLGRFQFDPHQDIALDSQDCWRWSSAKPSLHTFPRELFASRREDGRAETL